jgi:hypothetical protein
MKKLLIFLAMLSLVFMLACGGSKKETPANDGDVISDEDTTDADSDDTGDTEKPDEPDTDEPDDKDDSDTASEKDDSDSDTSDTGITDNDTDSDTGTTDNDIPGGDDDNDTPDNDIPEVTENHKISGAYQISGNVSGIEVFLHECGKTQKIAFANTDSDGKYSFNADISADKVYCVNANNFYSCFAGMSDHTANISEITNVVALISTCPDFRKNETKVRKYAKLGTGEWLGELDYTKLSGIKEGLRLLSAYLDTTESKKLSEEIADDILRTDSKFQKFFNGFKIAADKKEVLINVTNTDSNEVTLNIEGGSSVVAENFKITWTVMNNTAEAATHKFKSTDPGEYTVRAKLVYSGDPIMGGNDDDGGDPIMISEDSSTILFLLEKLTGTINVSDMSKDISKYIDNGIYAVIPKNTVIKKNGNKLNTLTYQVLTAGDGSQVSKIDFGPDGTEFTGDSMYFVYELGTVFGGDPIMLAAKAVNSDGSSEVLQSAGGDPIMLTESGNPMMFSAGGDPIMHIARSSGGDPIMYSAGGDPIMISDGSDPVGAAAGGDPIMIPVDSETSRIAAGDPIMLGTSSSVMISKTGHFSEFLINANSLPVSVEALVARWCDGSYYHGYSPIEFIKKGVTDNDPGNTLLPYLTCNNDHNFGDLGNDLYELINKQAGFQRNLNLIENIYYISEFYNRMMTKKNNGEVAAAKNGLELRSLLASLFTATTSYNRSATLADLFDSSKIPLTYNGNTPADYSADAQKAVTGLSEVNDKYVATKKDVMIFANYVTTSQKGPDFSGVTSVLTPDKFVCAWFNPDTAPQSCSKVYKLNGEGHVSIGSTAISVSDAEKIFEKFFMPMNSRLSEEEKLGLFRTYYLVLKYIGTVFYGGDKVDTLNKNLLKTAYLVFDGIDRNMNAVRITDTFDAAANTVQVFENGELETKPYLNRLSSLTDLISLDVATAANVEKVLINTVGFAYDKVTRNTRTYYDPVGDPIENSIILTPGELPAGIKPLKDLIGSNDVDSLGNITGKMTIVVNSKISGKTYSTQKTYEFLINDLSEGIDSKPLPSNLLIRLEDASGNPIDTSKNPGIILNPGGKTFYPNEENEDGEIKIENLAPASYTIDAFADGYYGKNVGVNLPENATIGVTVKLDEKLNSSSEALLTVKVSIGTLKHPDKVYIQIYDQDMELVGNEAAKFNEISNGYDDVTFDIDFGRYTLLAVGEEMYNYIEAITVGETETVKEITVVAKNACGNGIIDAGEECETGDLTSTEVRCGDVFHASTNPDNKAVCNKTTCVYDKAACGAPTYSDCGDGIIDPGEGCDGGSKSCSEILGASAKGTAPCRTNCSDWETAGNCSRTYEYCGDENLPLHAIWNDGIGRFTQTYNGSKWMPETPEPAVRYGTTRDECVFSCDKGYKWDSATQQCLADPLSLGNICTGQERCFDNGSETECPAYGKLFFGQDAQYAEVGYCTPKSFSTTGSGNQQIVVDDFTHYQWHKVASTSAKTWAEAEYECNNSTYGGKQLYWRLPSPAELLTIIDSGLGNHVLADIFTTSGRTFWAKEDNGNSENAWRIDENGALESVAKTTSNYFICVHNEYEIPAERFTAAAETVTDNFSGLIWQKQYASSKSWAEALTYCENSSAGEKYDWRLPNRNELASLVDYTGADGTMSAFPGIAAKEFWTSTSSVSEPAKAWTVDFGSGAISAGSKDDTKYLICVRKDEQCLGTECVNPCSFDPCRNTVNSTGVCKPSEGGDSYSCLCYSGYEWQESLSKCVIPDFRTQGCDIDKLPDNAVWNQTPTITQYPDGQGNWYPTTVPEYNEVPSTSECRFKCKDHYSWDYDLTKCLLDKKLALCTGTLPGHAVWTVSQIVQEWSLSAGDWMPRENEMIFNEDASINKCSFKCDENYTWLNNMCTANTREDVDCKGRPEHASWNTASKINQVWNGNDWYPSENAVYNEAPSENECRYKCHDNYFYHDSDCLPSPCESQTCAIPNSSGVCTAYAWNEYECECTNGTFWNGSECQVPLSIGNICTGQNKCYDDSNEEIECPVFSEDLFGQDAFYAAARFCIPQNFTVDSRAGNEVTVFDNNTGLEWQKTAVETESWNKADEYCAGLTYAGKGGWRLPTVKELLTIIDNSRSNPAVNTDYFDSSDDVWASETYNEKAWYVRFGTTGNSYSGAKSKTGKYARCVKGHVLRAPEFVESTVGEDEIVTDTTTGLIWQKSYYESKTTWQDALDYCKNLTYAGFSDWRVPNKNELVSILNVDNYLPATDFPDVPSENSLYFWTSSTRLYSSYAWGIGFASGDAGGAAKGTSSDYVRCVRSETCNGGAGIWNGTECVNPCGNNYFWNGKECVSPCGTDSCADVEHSSGCIAISTTDYSCGCAEGYIWHNSECIPVSPATICTGQDKCYNNSEEISCPAKGAEFFGQDSQYASFGFCAPKKFVIDSTVEDEKTVVDSNTGLEWQYTVKNTSYYWEDADNYCRGLTYAGKTGWRLPTRKEFYSIVDNSRTNPPTDPEYFNDTRKFWTSKVYAQENSTSKWYLDFSDGSSGVDKSTKKYARCVRGTDLPNAVLVSSTVDGDDIITDTTSGLVWQKTYVSNKTWQEALDYCENQTYAGYSDWRLPNLNELFSLINDDKFSPASDLTNVAKVPYWTSTSSMTNVNEALYVNFYGGSIGASARTTSGSRYVRCVR